MTKKPKAPNPIAGLWRIISMEIKRQKQGQSVAFTMRKGLDPWTTLPKG